MKKTLNNKGFTLIEIIGIVVILAVIMIVTVPLLENTLRNSDKKRLEAFKKNLVLVSENYIVNNNLLNETSELKIMLSDLLEQNYIDEIPEVLSDDPFSKTSEGEKNYYSYVIANKQSGEFYYKLCLSDDNCVDLTEISDETITYYKPFLDINLFRNISYRINIKNLYFVNHINTTDAIQDSIVDLSVAQNGQIKGWAIDNRDGTYDYYIGSEKTIYCGSLSRAFFKMSKLVSIDFDNLDTSEVRDMSYMFAETYSLTTLDLSSFDTSNVINMSHMFEYAKSLTTLDLSNLDTSEVTNMSYMFCGNENLANLYLGDLDTSEVRDMSYMFYDNKNLANLYLSSFDTSNVNNMLGMFYFCRSLTDLNLSSFNTLNVIDMLGMFDEMSALKTLDISNFTFNDKTKEQYLASDSTTATVYVNSASKDIVETNMSGATVVVKSS